LKLKHKEYYRQLQASSNNHQQLLGQMVSGVFKGQADDESDEGSQSEEESESYRKDDKYYSSEEPF
jgi:hypothetical protein